MGTDRARQEDEVASLAEIYDEEEFSRIESESSFASERSSPTRCRLSGYFTLPEKLLKVKYLNQDVQRRCPSLPYLKFFVKNLPPVTLHITCPSNYPSINPPDFRVSVSWLPPLEISKICQKLDELWEENRGNEILFIWMNFLKFELIGFLGIQYCLDISFLFTAFENPDYYLKADLGQLSDPRATNEKIFTNPRVYLAKYDIERRKILFLRNVYTCKICLDEFSGRQCLEFKKCDHVCCKICVTEYVSLKIREGQVKSIVCPEEKCKSEVTPDQVKELVSPDLFERYEYLLLKVTLDSMSDITYCPRVSCQYPVTKDEDETLATCAKCRYNFCVYCGKVYHGVTPCAMNSQEQSKLIVEYQAANGEQKKILEKKYGRKQLQIIVEKQLTNSYLKENTKQCPNCSTPTIKIEGCNKMICSYCRSHFCWLCGKHLTGPNPYEHFKERENNPCFERLFEGIELPDQDVLDNDIEEELWEEFPQIP